MRHPFLEGSERLLKEGWKQKRDRMQFAAVSGSPWRMSWKGSKRMLGDGPYPLPKG